MKKMSTSALCRLTIMLLIIAFPLITPGVLAEGNKRIDVSSILKDLQTAISNNENERAQALVEELKSHGDESVQAIQSTLIDQERFRAALVQVLGGIPGDTSTEALLILTSRDPNSQLAAISIQRIGNRPINRRLSEKELKALIANLNVDNVFLAGSVARLLSRCASNDVAERAKPIIARFKKAVNNSTSTTNSKIPHGSYLSREVLALNAFLVAFSQFDDKEVIPLLRQEMTGSISPNLQKWLTIALGFAGDETTAAQLQQLVQNERDISIRAIALRAYALSAKEKAIPFLKTFKEDKTSIGTDLSGEIFPLRQVALDEIARLGREGINKAQEAAESPKHH